MTKNLFPFIKGTWYQFLLSSPICPSPQWEMTLLGICRSVSLTRRCVFPRALELANSEDSPKALGNHHLSSLNRCSEMNGPRGFRVILQWAHCYRPCMCVLSRLSAKALTNTYPSVIQLVSQYVFSVWWSTGYFSMFQQASKCIHQDLGPHPPVNSFSGTFVSDN